MVTYYGLRRNPQAFQQLTGISVDEFESLYADFEPAWVAAESARLQRPGRQRAVGGGNDYKLDVETQLVMVLVWLRLYLTTATLAYFFGVSQSTASRNTRRLLAVLHQVSGQTFEWPEPPRRGHGRTTAELAQASPDLFAILDATEQPIETPQDKTREQRAYSGKRQRATCKNSLIVNEEGRIRGVTPSALGRTHDLTQIRQSGLLSTIAKDKVVVADASYIGLDKDLPDHSVAIAHRAQRDHPLQQDHKDANRELSSVRIVVENVFCHLKHFQSLSQRFRHDVEQVHSAVFAVVAMLVDRRTQSRLAAQNRA
jgi:DDE superfamily endonuclease/Helix-turn-helix of DDE superfamily endonuclease